MACNIMKAVQTHLDTNSLCKWIAFLYTSVYLDVNPANGLMVLISKGAANKFSSGIDLPRAWNHGVLKWASKAAWSLSLKHQHLSKLCSCEINMNLQHSSTTRIFTPSLFICSNIWYFDFGKCYYDASRRV